MLTVRISNFFSKRLLIILLLGFSSGLPLALVGSTLQAWFSDAHVSVISIGVLSLVGLPYSFKFLWAPIMDHYSPIGPSPRLGWILLMQGGVFATLLLLANLSPQQNPMLIGGFAFLLAFFSASQDIAINAYQTDILTEEERGLGVSYYIFAYRVAMLISGGMALLFAYKMGWTFTYQCMGLLIFFSMLVTLFAPREKTLIPLKRGSHAGGEGVSLLQTISFAWRDLLRRDKILILLLFIILYKFGDALALQLMTNFLLNGLGFTLSDVAWAFKVVGFVATILGGFIGGMLLMRWPIFNALLVFGLAQTFSNLMFVVLAEVGKNYALLASSMFIENFCSGLSTAALFAFIMSLCNHRYSASQFALLSAIAMLGRVVLGPVAGMMVAYLGWVQFYIWSFVLCFPGIVMLVLLKDQVKYHAQTATD